jgi:glycosyltransferase involved in cell wall biosynthesis
MSEKLAIAILHYHLRPGGVTRVIERAVESLGDRVDVLVLTGEAPAPGDALTPVTEPFQPLEYSDHPLPEIEKQVENLRFTARCLLGRDPDIWHIHNPALGKNSFLPQLVCQLANAGCRLLLQPHDFAEDGRPENYRLLRDHLGDELGNILYPVANHVGYAPINFRDKAFLESIGLPHVHELPNAVDPHVAQAFQPAQGRQNGPPHKTIVYPARAIRRKNMGEFLLWSLLAPEGYRFISTLAPQNPKAQPIYNEWVAFAEELNLPVEFDAGRTTRFAELVQNATALISTSIAEGFGLAFLEPWLEGKMLVGRNIPEITTDFAEDGLDLSSLYTTLPIPLEWVGKTTFFQTLETAMKETYAAYSRAWKADYFGQAKTALVTDGTVDFGILNEPLQRNVIRHLKAHPADRESFPPLMPPASHLINHNRKVVAESYSLKAYGNRLFGIYQQLAATQLGEVSAADTGKLLDKFLQPGRFNLLRT